MKLGSVTIDDTFAEAFGMRYTRVIITAHDAHWLAAAIQAFTGYATSVIACDAEAGVENYLDSSQTPDGRVGANILLFGFSSDALGKAVTNRAGQCLMTCPSTAVFSGLSGTETSLPLGKNLRFFGDGFQKSKQIAGRRYWRIPVMEGEFLIEESVGVERGVAGGNFILQATHLNTVLNASRAAVEAISKVPGVITPFPGGVARSGSKVGSQYKTLRASTNELLCPTLKGRVESQLHPDCTTALEVVIDGTTQAAVAEAMRVGMLAAAEHPILAITAGNYGGKLGKFHFRLHEVLAST